MFRKPIIKVLIVLLAFVVLASLGWLGLKIIEKKKAIKSEPIKEEIQKEALTEKDEKKEIKEAPEIEDSKFLWFEGEDAIDYSFYDQFYEEKQGVRPGLFASLKEKEKKRKELSNGHLFYINTEKEPWHKDGHFIKYEVNIPKQGTYSLHVREMITPQTSPIRWRFDEEEWRTITDYNDLPSQQNSQESNLNIRWADYGDVFLSKGKHIFQIVIEKNSHRAIYTKAIDAFVLAKDKFITNGFSKPEGTNEQIKLPSIITLEPTNVIDDNYYAFNRGIEEYLWNFANYQEKLPNLADEILKIIKDLKFSYIRFPIATRLIYPEPNIFSSQDYGKIRTWFLDNYQKDITNQKELDGFIISLSQSEKKQFIRNFYKFIDEENIIIREPMGYNEKFLNNLDKFFKFFNDNGIKAVLVFDDVPRWLSSNPMASDYFYYTPKDMKGYANLLKLLIKYFNEKYPNLIEYWEVQNEPSNLENCMIKSSFSPTSEEYQKRKVGVFYRMYDAAVKATSEIDPNIKIGGPGDLPLDKVPSPKVLGGYPELLIKHCAKNNKRISFLSWHRYADDLIGIKNEIQKARQILAKYKLTEVELFIDEWSLSYVGKVNFSDGVSDYEKMIFQILDNNVMAAYVAGALQTMVDSGLKYTINHSLIQYGVREFKDDFVPTWGLVVQSHPVGKPPQFIKRSVYYTFKMFNMLDNKRIRVNIDNGVNMGAIATKSDDGKQINLLIWNYDQSERTINKKIKIKIPAVKNIKYDHYLINSKHTLYGAEELEIVEKEISSNGIIDFELETNSVTLFRIKIIK